MDSSRPTDDQRIREIRELVSPWQLLAEQPVSPEAARTTATTREAIHQTLEGSDDRLVVVVGPCSINDPDAARE